MFSNVLIEEAKNLLEDMSTQKWRLATAESCTGGMLSTLLTEIPGSSRVFECGFITYSNEAKTEMLGVKSSLLKKHGAVSEQVAIAMAEGALKHSRAQLSVSITGVAGPDGGTKEKPVGLVYIASARKGKKTSHKKLLLQGDRDIIRFQSVIAALELLSSQL